MTIKLYNNTELHVKRHKILICIGTNEIRNNFLLNYIYDHINLENHTVKILKIIDSVAKTTGLFSFDSFYFIAQDREHMEKSLNETSNNLKKRIPHIIVESDLREGYIDDEVMKELKGDDSISMVLLSANREHKNKKLIRTIIDNNYKEHQVPILIIPTPQ